MPIDSEQNVTVPGRSYIGLPTAALIARSGSKVTGIDISRHVVDTVNNGKVHIEEVPHSAQIVSLCSIAGTPQPDFVGKH